MTSTHDIAHETKDQARELSEHARSAGQDIASNARSAASEVGGTAKEQATNVASTARDEVRDLASQAKTQMRTQAEDQTRRLAQNIRQISEQLREMASKAGSDGTARDLVQQAAHHGTRAADFIESRGPSGVVDEVQQFARRRPAAFLLAATVAGIVVGRATRAAKGQSSAGDTAAATAERNNSEPSSLTERSTSTAPTGQTEGNTATALAGESFGGER